MRFWGRHTRQLYNRIFSTMNKPIKTFQWKNIEKGSASLKSVTTKFDATSISMLSDVVNIILKIGVPVAYAVGFLVISSYLSSIGAPLLISDFSTTLWFISLAALIAFFVILLTTVFFFPPALIFPTSAKSLRYTKTNHPTKLILSSKEFMIEWFANHGIPLAFLFAVTLVYFINLSWTSLAISVVLVCGSIVLVPYLIRHYSTFYNR
jgi:hypothetical protein